MELACKDCGFHFDGAEVKNTCPYCGEKGSVIELKGAEDLLEE